MKKILIPLLLIILVLSNLTSCSMVTQYIKKPIESFKKADEKIEETKEKDEEIEETEEPAPEAVEAEPVNLKDFLGNWHPGDHAGKVELSILSVDSYFVEFSLWFEGEGEFNDISAAVDGNTASFDIGNIVGKLVFEKDLIQLHVESSDVAFLSSGVVVFDGKHTASYQENAKAEEKADSSVNEDGVLEPREFITPFMKYVSTPNTILNLRTGPSMDYEVIYKLPDLTRVEIHGYSDDGTWVYAYYNEEGIYGWCSNDFLIYSLDERY